MSFLESLEQQAAPVRDTVRSSLENGTTLRITAARSWLDAGRQVNAADDLEMRDSGIVEYVPGDFTITVRAGTPLAEIEAVTEANGQWLPLEPFGSDSGTVGATVVTASAGPLAHAFGTPRDQVIGLGFVTGKGDYVRSGGRVVKNVAGFDLTRLLVGSWGTLGVVTDVTLRLRARPDVDSTICLVLSDDSARFRRTLGEIGEAPLTPYAMELLNRNVAETLGLGRETVLLTRLGGNAPAVAAQRETIGQLGEIRELDADVWRRLRTIEPEGAAVVRLSGALAEFAAVWGRAERELEGLKPLLHGTPGRGQLRCIVPATAAETLTRMAAGESKIRHVFERLPAPAWELTPAFPNVQLSRRVREAFDPASLLNPGILGQQLS